ncbi:MAG: hypothetical protein RSJ40_09280, partial [Acetivibrio sp.]
MKNKEIKERLRRAVEAQTPDIYQNVASKPIVKKEEMINMRKGKNIKKAVYAVGLAMAACLCVFVVGVQAENARVISIVDMDLNPSLEIQINGKDQVTE